MGLYNMWQNLILLLALYSFSSMGQVVNYPPSPPQLTPEEYEQEIKNRDCHYKNLYGIKDRLKFYPFNSAVKIQVVSFENNGLERLPIKNDSICYSKLTEVKALNDSEIKLLSDILYNNFYKGKVIYNTTTACFIPRNAIVFINAKGKPFEYIEVCFECFNYQSSSEKIITGDPCNQKVRLLKDFFVKAGITKTEPISIK